MTKIPDPKEKYLSTYDLRERYQCGRSTLYRWIREKRFPKGYRIGVGRRRWALKEIERWERETGTKPA